MVFLNGLLVSFFLKNIINPNSHVSPISGRHSGATNLYASPEHKEPTLNEKDEFGCKLKKQSTWRLFNIEVPHNLDPGKNSVSPHDPLISAVIDALPLKKIPFNVTSEDVTVVKKAFDGRWRKTGQPKWVYTVDLAIPASTSQKFTIKEVKGRIEKVSPPKSTDSSGTIKTSVEKSPSTSISFRGESPRIVVVGAGPSGLFAAIRLVEAGYKPIIIERGEPVEVRGRDIGALFNRKVLNGESNLCYGEGGAGTWSDGKLTTRIGKNSDVVR